MTALRVIELGPGGYQLRPATPLEIARQRRLVGPERRAIQPACLCASWEIEAVGRCVCPASRADGAVSEKAMSFREDSPPPSSFTRGEGRGLLFREAPESKRTAATYARRAD